MGKRSSTTPPASKGTQAHIGTVASEDSTPSFETVRIKLRPGSDVKPGVLLRIPTRRNSVESILIARVRSAHEHNPNESAEDINVRDGLGLQAVYPGEADSTTIYRMVIANLIQEIITYTDDDGKEKIDIVAPQTLAVSGSNVYESEIDEVIAILGLEPNSALGINLGTSASGTKVPVILKRAAIQRHLFIGGTTGSGKSYGMGVITEELVRQQIPVIFLDTQDEYATLVQILGGQVVIPGDDFTIRLSSLNERELLDLIPSATPLQQDIIAAAFMELKSDLKQRNIEKFGIEELLDRIHVVGPGLTNTASSVDMAARRTSRLRRNKLFGTGVSKNNWPKLMFPCLSIRCKGLTASKLQTVATALLRELQDLRMRDHIPPYMMVVDEAHLFVPQGESSPCKQIIREGVRIGRHHGIAMTLLTQSPVDIDKSVIRQCNTRLIFALEPDQLDAIRGVKADATEEMLNALPKMPQGRCLLSGTYETIRHTIPVQIRKRHNPDSEGGQTPDIFSEMLSERWRDLLPNNTSEESADGT